MTARVNVATDGSQVALGAELPATMRAVVLFGPGDMRLVEDYSTPIPGPGDAIVRVDSCAICTTDFDILQRGWPHHPPYGDFVFGHEYAGTVVALGEQVRDLSIGDRVAAEPHHGCGHCQNCLDGKYTTCLNYGLVEQGHRHYGFTVNGGYAEYARSAPSCLHPVPSHWSFETATLLTTAGTALYSLQRIGGLQGGETVVVSGPGPVGLMGAVLARLTGAGTIIMTGTRRERLELGLRLGADKVIDVTSCDVVEEVLKLTGGKGADVVLECAGTESSAAAAVEYTKLSGRIAFVGVHPDKPTIALNARHIALGNLTIAGTRAEGGRSVERASVLLGASQFDVSVLVTDTFSLLDIHSAFTTAEDRIGGAIKVIVKPSTL
jgi:threonine dehydrogenase-like Zn-dependent dehydrogenase